MEKVFFTIELVAKSWKNKHADAFEKWSYAYVTILIDNNSNFNLKFTIHFRL